MTARGFDIRSGQRRETILQRYDNAKTDDERAAMLKQFPDVFGQKGDSWKSVALQGGTDAQGNKTESILGAVNERTGEMKRMEGQRGLPPAMPPGMVKQVGTSGGKPVYEDANGKRFLAG